MRNVIRKLREFHTKQRFPLDVSLAACSVWPATDRLNDVASVLQALATDLERQCKDTVDLRMHRAQLMVEELGETIEAMAKLDDVALVDGLSDLQFVTIGASEAFGLPTEAGLNEVCDSNLTKDPRSDADHRLRDKGPNYRPPNILRVLDEWYAHRDACRACSHRAEYPNGDRCSRCPNNDLGDRQEGL